MVFIIPIPQSVYDYLRISLQYTIGKKLVSTYFVDGTMYKRICKRNRSPVGFLSIRDENGNDVYTDVIPFFGPEKSVEGLNLTPHDMGYKELTFVTMNFNEKSFGTYEILSFPIATNLR